MKTAIVNFNGGEYSPKIDARADTEKHAGGCRKLENMIPSIFGGAEKRPGTEFITIGGAGCYFEPPASDPTKIGISTAAELQLVGSGGAYPITGDYELLNDIDCTGIDWVPINSVFGAPFAGTFDGRYFTISNMSVTISPGNTWQGAGLFGQISSAGSGQITALQRIIIINASITSTYAASMPRGLLVGLDLHAGTTIYDCYTQGSIQSNTNINLFTAGGLIGQPAASGIYLRCGTDVTITAAGTGTATMCGGFSGRSDNGRITYTDCYAIATITAGTLNIIGGFSPLTTYRDNVDVRNIYTNCYCATTISGSVNSNVGGFLGAFSVGSDMDEDFNSCYWDGDVQGVLDLEDCGLLASTGVAGDLDGVTKSTTSAMQTQATFTDAGWDFTPNTGVWRIRPNDYPRHQWWYNATECVWIHN